MGPVVGSRELMRMQPGPCDLNLGGASLHLPPADKWCTLQISKKNTGASSVPTEWSSLGTRAPFVVSTPSRGCQLETWDDTLGAVFIVSLQSLFPSREQASMVIFFFKTNDFNYFLLLFTPPSKTEIIIINDTDVFIKFWNLLLMKRMVLQCVIIIQVLWKLIFRSQRACGQ